MTYSVIHNDAGEQIGYLECDSAFSLSGKLLYHVDKHLNLARRGDGRVVGQVVIESGIHRLHADANDLFGTSQGGRSAAGK